MKVKVIASIQELMEDGIVEDDALYMKDKVFDVVSRGSYGYNIIVNNRTYSVRKDQARKLPEYPEYDVDKYIPFKHEETKDSNPKAAAATTRLDISLWPMTATVYGALGMTEGDYKYRGYNYRLDGVSVSTYISALSRHTAKFYNGEWEDQKTGVPHLASMLSCIAIIVDGFECGNINDDRPPSMDMCKLLNRLEGNVAKLQEIFPNAKGQVTQLELNKKLTASEALDKLEDRHIDLTFAGSDYEVSKS